MSEWLRRSITTLAVIVLVAGLVRLAWELLRPAVPTLIALLVVLVIVRILWQRSGGW